MAPHFRRNEYGFSLTEVLIVLIVGGVLTAVAIPAFMAWAPTYRVNGAARQVFSEMMAARAKAISENNNYVITFDTAGNSFEIHDNDDSDIPAVKDTGETVKTIAIGVGYPGIIISTTNPSGNAITGAVSLADPWVVLFRPSGLSTAGSVYLKPENDAQPEQYRCVSVNLTGRIRLYKHKSSGWE